MKALILTGGFGTRLRPLTLHTPKPILPIANRPLLLYQIEMLKKVGIREIILATCYKPRLLKNTLDKLRLPGIRLHYIQEKRPLGTGGAVKNAASFLDDTFLVLNGDILSDFDLKEIIRRHRKNRAEATLALARVKDPTLYGLVETDSSQRVRRFLEKPAWDEITAQTISAGFYVFEPSLLADIPPGVPYSLERRLFPHLLETDRRLFAHTYSGYWLDVGTNEKYLQANMDVLEKGLFSKRPPAGRLLGSRCRVGEQVQFHGPVCVGADCRIGRGAVLDHCVILEKSFIGQGARLENCIVGRRVRIGEHATIGSGTVLGDGCAIQSYSHL
ncbi:MAG: NDP-sugar synthase [Elusimicrobia bacterium]|nr:NDP-sugar synthase [Elusimicrobiota bacterium]